MTIFYVLLYYVWRKRYKVEGQRGVTVAVYALAAARVILCMMPQNQWLSAESSLSWGIYRNIPFALMGLLIIVLFYHSAKAHSDRLFRWMWLTIVLSFGFYIPVVLWADRDADDPQDLRICVDGGNRLFRHEERVQVK